MFDVIVCGAGVQGLSTAYNLVKKGKKVLVLEQFPLPHIRGSSHGSSRITRHSYLETRYADMMPECFQKWKELSEMTDMNLFKNCGLITLGNSDAVSSVENSLNNINIPYQTFKKNEELQKKFGGLSLGKLFAVYEPAGGVLVADRCLQALQIEIKRNGGRIIDGEKVMKIEEVDSDYSSSSYIRVRTDKSTYPGSKLVLTCGSWINKVIKQFGIQYPVKPLKINVLYWKTKSTDCYDIKNFPCIFIEEGPLTCYSLPVMEYPGHMKVCFHHGISLNPDEPAKISKTAETVRQRQLQYVIECIKTHYPELDTEPAIQESCIYTNTPDHDPILEALPGHPNIIVGAGFSGHGFKLAPAIGHILGNLASGEPAPYPLEPFSSKRFKNKSNL